MKMQNYCRLLIPTLGIVATSALGAGCANSSNAPYHMYDSPLLEGRVESRYPRSRAYDPLELGDHRQPTTYYASNDAGADAPKAPVAERRTATPPKDAKEVADEPAEAREEKSALPALSTTRHASEKEEAAAGGPATTDASARASKEEAQSEQPAPTTEPALAAQYVSSVYGLNGVEFSQASSRSIPKLFRECKDRGKIYHSSRPAIGDIVFFHNTDDYNEDGRNNDWYTHAALVESLGDDGEITLLGYRDGEVERFVMNLEMPDAAKTRHGQTANAQLRPKRSADAPFTQYLAGQLFAGSCSLLGEKAQVVVIDNWQPGMKLDK